MKKIALEEHFITAELSQYSMDQSSVQSIRAAGGHSAAKVQQRFALQLVEFDGMRLEAMDKAGIELSVLSVTTPGVQAEKDARTAIRLARAANDFLAREIQRHPTRYAGFAHLPLQDPKAAADELGRCVAELGFKGAMINGHTNGRYLDGKVIFRSGSACRNSMFRFTCIRAIPSICRRCIATIPNCLAQPGAGPWKPARTRSAWCSAVFSTASRT